MPQVLFIRSLEEPDCFHAVKQSPPETSGINIDFADTLDEAEGKIRSESDWRGLVVLVVRNKEDLLPVLGFLSMHHAHIKTRKSMRVLAFNQVDHGKAVEALIGKGCAEVVEDFSLPLRSLIHKMNRHLKLVGKKKEPVPTPPPVKNPMGVVEGGNTAPAVDPHSIELLPPLHEQPDFWFLRKITDAKKVARMWLIQMVGPSPAVGSWVEESTGIWIWTDRVTVPLFNTQGGKWIFEGKQPEFDTKSLRWNFVGAKAKLYFIAANGEEHFRFRFGEELRELRSNSKFAIDHLSLIEETLNPEFRFKRDEKAPVENEEKDEFQSSADSMQPMSIQAAIQGVSVGMLQFNERGLELDAPSELCKEGETVHLRLKTENFNPSIDEEMSARIDSIRMIEDRAVLSISLPDSKDLETLSHLRSLIEKRQEKINRFLFLAKGY